MIREAFNRAGAKREGTRSIDFLDAIYMERPDLKDQPSYFPSQGQKGHTVIFGNEVFKGPRESSGECLDDFNTECETLKALEGKQLSTAIPRITTEGKNFLFFGMTRVPGVVMGGDYESNLTKDQQRALAKDLINFVVELANALPRKDGKFAVHDDLWYSNIFIDPDTKRLSGVIDFGLVKYKKASEWKPMFDFEGSDFYDMLQEEFDRRKSELSGAKAEVRPAVAQDAPASADAAKPAATETAKPAGGIIKRFCALFNNLLKRPSVKDHFTQLHLTRRGSSPKAP